MTTVEKGQRVQLKDGRMGVVVDLSFDLSKVYVRLDTTGRDVRMAARNVAPARATTLAKVQG
jgi:hypothetical protein